MENMWKQCQKEGNAKNIHLISDPTQRVPGFDYTRAVWINLVMICEHSLTACICC